MARRRPLVAARAVREPVGNRIAHSILMNRQPELAIVWWCVVAAMVSLTRPLSARGRHTVLGGASALGVAAVLSTLLPTEGAAGAVRNVLPALFVLAAYWVAGAFFVAPDRHLEDRLLACDRWVLGPLRLQERLTGRSRWVLATLETAYLAVYAVLPLGAWAAWAHGRTPAVERYWTLVFLSEATCYLALAWVQTRPPRVLEPWVGALRAGSVVRRANEAILRHGSIQVNTLPSGHVAGAVAVAVALAWLEVPVAPAFGVLAVAISAATVAGRYHFLADTVAAAVVPAVWWWLLSGWCA